ncbi:MAG: DevR family CRISPR-associated autoregulator [Methanolobus sp. T82-4]|nr:MAG: DevR family CRISPR-associated autoregulator [Methanolobus sp. T82-4]
MKTIIGTYLIDAPFSALNNSGIDKSAANENEIATKVIYSPEGTRPYVSAQALRYWWRTVLENKFDWKCSPVLKVTGKSQAVTAGNPLKYDDDDVFGYMSARKEETGKTDKNGKPKLQNVTVTRVSPLKCSPLIGFPIRPTNDFGVLVRKHDGNPIPYNHQFYSNILKGIFSLDIDSVGRFTAIDKPGSKNLTKELKDEYEKAGLKVNEHTYILDIGSRKKRIDSTLKALKYLNGGAMQTLHNTDVTPKLIILAALNGGNNIFMNVIPHNDYRKGLVNIDALYEVLDDYKDDLLTNVYIGKISGFGTDYDEELKTFKAPKGVEVKFSTPVKAIDGFVEEISKNTIIGE